MDLGLLCPNFLLITPNHGYVKGCGVSSFQFKRCITYFCEKHYLQCHSMPWAKAQARKEHWTCKFTTKKVVTKSVLRLHLDKVEAQQAVCHYLFFFFPGVRLSVMVFTRLPTWHIENHRTDSFTQYSGNWYRVSLSVTNSYLDIGFVYHLHD